jgi:cyclase
VKTTRFADPKYVGDPINAVRIFNEKQVDELVVLDIDATRDGREPDYAMVRNLAGECQMPLCYGGGVTSVDQMERIVSLGVEKVSLGAMAVSDPGLITRASKRVGNQSVVVVIDVRRAGLLRRYEVVTHNATRRTGLDPAEFAERVADLGAGEIVLNSVDKDGTMSGYDLELVDRVSARVSVPLTILGGAGQLADIASLIKRLDLVGAAAGSLFVFKGKYRAVLINYPDQSTRDQLIGTG